jgi:hypothetical protein
MKFDWETYQAAYNNAPAIIKKLIDNGLDQETDYLSQKYSLDPSSDTATVTVIITHYLLGLIDREGVREMAMNLLAPAIKIEEFADDIIMLGEKRFKEKLSETNTTFATSEKELLTPMNNGTDSSVPIIQNKYQLVNQETDDIPTHRSEQPISGAVRPYAADPKNTTPRWEDN